MSKQNGKEPDEAEPTKTGVVDEVLPLEEIADGVLRSITEGNDG